MDSSPGPEAIVRRQSLAMRYIAAEALALLENPICFKQPCQEVVSKPMLLHPVVSGEGQKDRCACKEQEP